MKLTVSSSVVNGIYAVFHLITVIFLTRFLKTILGCWNVKKAYDDEEQIELKGSPWESIADHGLSSNVMQRFSFTTVVLVIILLSVGDFAIVGTSEDKLEDVQVKNLVTRAPHNDPLDIEKHVSLEQKTVSSSMLLLLEFLTCVMITPDGITVYQYHNDLPDLATPRWTFDDTLDNSTCISPDNGFETRTITDEPFWYAPKEFSDEKCVWTVDPTGLPPAQAVRVNVSQADDCPYPVIEAWCIQTDMLMCAGLSTVAPEGFVVNQQPGKSKHDDMMLFKQRPDSIVLKSTVLLMAMGLHSRGTVPLVMSILTVEENATVRKVNGDREVTKIDVTLFAVTSGVGCAVVAVIGVAALLLWIKVLVLPKRLKYNRFNSTLDLVSYLTAERADELDLRLRVGRRAVFWVGDHIGAVGAFEDEERSVDKS